MNDTPQSKRLELIRAERDESTEQIRRIIRKQEELVESIQRQLIQEYGGAIAPEHLEKVLKISHLLVQATEVLSNLRKSTN